MRDITHSEAWDRAELYTEDVPRKHPAWFCGGGTLPLIWGMNGHVEARQWWRKSKISLGLKESSGGPGQRGRRMRVGSDNLISRWAPVGAGGVEPTRESWPETLYRLLKSKIKFTKGYLSQLRMLKTIKLKTFISLWCHLVRASGNLPRVNLFTIIWPPSKRQNSQDWFEQV